MRTDTSWPAHSAICIDCRTAHPASASVCEASARHRLRHMDNPEHREELLTEVWGPPSVRRRARELAKASGAGAGSGAVLDGCGGCGDLGLASLGEAAGLALVVLAASLIFVLLYFLGKLIYEFVQRRRHRLRPHGALKAGPALERRTGRTGVVEPRATLPAPVTGEACVAYGVMFRCKRFLRNPLMLRDGATLGFDVRLDDGTRVHIPAGRVLLGMHGARKVEADQASPALHAYLARLDPGRHGPEHEPEHDPLPAERIDVQLVLPGTRVEVRGALEPTPDPQGTGDYRSAAVVLTPRGVPHLAVDRG